MKLLEKDIHEKQDTVISLRRQLEDIKLINLDMYKKLQVCQLKCVRLVLGWMMDHFTSFPLLFITTFLYI